MHATSQHNVLGAASKLGRRRRRTRRRRIEEAFYAEENSSLLPLSAAQLATSQNEDSV
jgi:hypothetical protein